MALKDNINFFFNNYDIRNIFNYNILTHSIELKDDEESLLILNNSGVNKHLRKLLFLYKYTFWFTIINSISILLRNFIPSLSFLNFFVITYCFIAIFNILYSINLFKTYCKALITAPPPSLIECTQNDTSENKELRDIRNISENPSCKRCIKQISANESDFILKNIYISIRITIISLVVIACFINYVVYTNEDGTPFDYFFPLLNVLFCNYIQCVSIIKLFNDLIEFSLIHPLDLVNEVTPSDRM
ncbi:hypothetical protein TBLA_0B00710 [Henningerozyma blattae CBS 6284]|uniref:Uncharacterized protein n=1 Tax=Henningerozyma blattae (strain ATCC 34711 / CBS 6284 / DSM 70876 / NBRC 10599 / NRRL Y-10934 / UCD 77-7) TaxID=1071380 RepID=I2GXR2_HENB6|nr:hypothetical protein TBLA_0B00710 [Tetrapisispora blattae CBS 6284]CCH58914.1 hypothetical protein TBLA_0B00710 [Tetrapisispora blattae CBS 6284]